MGKSMLNGECYGSDNANDIVYDNTTSGLTATNTKSAIDELATSVSELNSNLNGIEFAQDEEGNWGYIPSGADSVIPFKKYSDIAVTTTDNSYNHSLANGSTKKIDVLSGKGLEKGDIVFAIFKASDWTEIMSISSSSNVTNTLIYSITSTTNGISFKSTQIYLIRCTGDSPTFVIKYGASKSGTDRTKSIRVITVTGCVHTGYELSPLLLYNKGNDCSSVHGGFEGLAICGFGRGAADWLVEPTITYGSSSIKIQGMISHYSSVFTKNTIDITNYTTCRIVTTSATGGRVGFTQTKADGYEGTYATISSATTTTLDISTLTGEYYLAIEVDGGNYLTISQIILE